MAHANSESPSDSINQLGGMMCVGAVECRKDFLGRIYGEGADSTAGNLRSVHGPGGSPPLNPEPISALTHCAR